MQYTPTYTSTLAHMFRDFESLRRAWKNEIREEAGINFTDEYLDDIYSKAFKEAIITYKNSVRGTERNIGALDFIRSTFDEDKIIVENGVFFQNSRKVFAPTVESEIYLFKRRKKVKKKGNYYLTEGQDPVLGAIYDNLQKNIKILMNTYYGVLTNPYSRFFNRDLGDSITTRGRSSISVSALSVEGAFTKRIPLKTEALLAYFIRCTKEVPEVEDFSDMVDIFKNSYSSLSDEDKIIVEFNLSNHYDVELIRKRLKSYSLEEKTIIFFKNNFKRLTEMKEFKSAVEKLFRDTVVMEKPFLDPNEIPYDGADIYIDKLKRLTRSVITAHFWYSGDYIQEREILVSNPQEVIQGIDRKVIPIIDTDSNFLSYETEYFMLYDLISKTKGNEYELKHHEDDYTFYTISNICAVIMTEVIDHALDRYKKHVNILPEKYDCLKLKNEFLYLKLLITSRKKSYIGLVALKEGKPYPKPKLDVKGLVFKKSSVNSNIGDAVETIVDKVIKSPTLDMSGILSDTREAAKTIVNKHKTQDLLNYCVALKIKTNLEETDKSDYRYKAISLWNYICQDEQNQISPPATFYAVPIQIKDSLRLTNNELYSRFLGWLDARNKEMVQVQLSRILDNPEDTKYEFFKFMSDNFDIYSINSTQDYLTLREQTKALIKERKLKIKSQNLSIMTVDDIDKIACPLTQEVVPDFLLEIVNPEKSDILVNSLIAPVVQELHLLCPRNSDGKRLITNIVERF